MENQTQAAEGTEREERLTVSYDEALLLLPEGDTIHTFRDGAGILIGADWGREKILDLLKQAKTIYVSGPMAMGMGYGLHTDHNGRLFIEATNADEVLP
jgi:hypothetical protein